mgnify:CR=1 FL=1
MARAKKKAKTKAKTSANVGYEAQLWLMADALRGSMDASEYKHVVLGLIFLKYISDAFEEQHARLDADGDGEITKADIEARAFKYFERLDANGDGTVTEQERTESREKRFRK